MSKTVDEKVQKNLRLPRSLLVKLSEAAKRERRSESAILEVALEQYFHRQDVTPLPEELIRAVEEYLERNR
ncbi:MAG: ribbon-helix-helix protein, CopG family [Candidatus Promineofilum sp.]|nr:ribbon-helix-helix protein, CopG family [Promineifilum sp.]MBP9658005.1 ribbon-helix-helix protein, CopG family [Promineifilum sp.]